MKNPYVNKMTPEQVKNAEEHFYYIQVGEEIQVYNSKMTFKKDVVDSLFATIMDGLRDMKEHGDKEEKRDAHYGLMNCRVWPLRIH